MNSDQNMIIMTISIIIFGGSLISNAYAYIDPGSGTLLLQMLVGALVGVGIALKLYWFKIKEKFSRMKNN